MKILITGGTGFLGSHLARRLLADGHTVTVLRRTPTQSSQALEDVDVRYALGDVTDAASVRGASDGQDLVIHAAAGYTGRGERPECFEINVAGTSSIVEACLDAQVQRLVHVSSVAAIGIPEGRTPVDEEFAFNVSRSRLHYHVSKHHAELAVCRGTARGLDAVIVNPASLWGPFGDTYRGSEAVRMVRGARRVPVSAGGVCVAHVDDVVEGMVSAIHHGASGARYILGGDNLTYREWMTKIAAALDVQPRFVPVARAATNLLARAAGPLASIDPRFQGPYVRAYVSGRCTFYDSSRAARELGYRSRSFDAILEECIRLSGPG